MVDGETLVLCPKLIFHAYKTKKHLKPTHMTSQENHLPLNVYINMNLIFSELGIFNFDSIILEFQVIICFVLCAYYKNIIKKYKSKL